MALPNDPSRDAIYAEFGSATKNSIANKNLKEMYQMVFGSGAYDRDSFGGKGQASLNSFSSGGDGTLGYVTVNIDSGGVPTTILAYSQSAVDENDNIKAAPDEGDWVQFQSLTTSVSGSHTLSAEIGPGTFFFKAEVYNGFISSDRLSQDSGGNSHPVQDPGGNDPQLDAPYLLNTISHGFYGFTLEWNTSGIEPTNFQFQYRFNGGTWKSPRSITNETNYGTTTDPKSASIQTDEFPSPGDTFEFRVKGSKPSYQDSIWSNIRSYSE